MAHLLNIFNYQTLLIIVLVISSHFMVTIFGAIAIRHCQKTEDCDENQCCTSIPASGKKICINYEQAGEMCFFRFRTPTCGCAKGLKCVSTSPMQPGDWNHDYVCARVRPFQYHKLVPYFENL